MLACRHNTAMQHAPTYFLTENSNCFDFLGHFHNIEATSNTKLLWEISFYIDWLVKKGENRSNLPGQNRFVHRPLEKLRNSKTNL
jgi:hypothetical protein